MDAHSSPAVSSALTRSGPAAPAGAVLRDGQSLKATVLRIEAGAPGSAQTTLQIGNRRMAARSTLALQVGDRLELLVSKSPQRITLVLTSVNGRPPLPPAPRLDQAIRQMLPLQTGYAPLLNLLKGAGPAERETAHPPLAGTVSRFLSHLPTVAQLSSPAELRSAWLDSGLFLESRLREGAPAHRKTLEGDLKGLLFRLLDALTRGPAGRPTPRPPAAQGDPSVTTTHDPAAGLAKLVEGNLARLGLQQLGMARAQGDDAPHWAFELPVCEQGRFDVLHFEIERRPRHRSHRPDTFSLTIDLDLPRTGPLKVRLGLVDQRLSATLWAQRETTVSAIRQALPRLGEMLERQGIRPDTLTCHHGAGPQSRRGTAAGPTTPLDLKA